MSRTLINTDDDTLARAQDVLGTSTKKETVNAALAQVVALEARRRFLSDTREGAFADARDERVMDQAWRQ